MNKRTEQQQQQMNNSDPSSFGNASGNPNQQQPSSTRGQPCPPSNSKFGRIVANPSVPMTASMQANGAGPATSSHEIGDKLGFSFNQKDQSQNIPKLYERNEGDPYSHSGQKSRDIARGHFQQKMNAQRKNEEHKSSLISAMEDIRAGIDDDYDVQDGKSLSKCSNTPEFVAREGTDLFANHGTRKQQLVAHTSPGNRYNIGSLEEERISPHTQLNNFMTTSIDGTEVLDQAIELRDPKQNHQLQSMNTAMPKNGDGFGIGSNYPTHSIDDVGMLQDSNRVMAPKANGAQPNLVSQSMNVGGPLINALTQQREIQRRSLEMHNLTNAPDEPSELLVRPEKRQMKQNEIDDQPNFTESNQQEDQQEQTNFPSRKSLAVAHIPSSPRSRSKSSIPDRDPGTPNSALSAGEYDISLAASQNQTDQQPPHTNAQEDADAVEQEVEAERNSNVVQQQQQPQLPSADGYTPRAGRICRQGDRERVAENGLSVPDEMEELTEHGRSEEGPQRNMQPVDDLQISPRIRNEESKEEDFRARNIEAAVSYAGRFGQTQPVHQQMTGSNSRQSRHYPTFTSSTPLRPTTRHHDVPPSSSTSPSINYNFRSSPYLSQSLRSPHQNIGGGSNSNIGPGIGGVGANNPQFGQPSHYQSLFNFGNRYENNRSSNSNSNGLIGDTMRVSSLGRGNPSGRIGPRQTTDRTLTQTGRPSAVRNTQANNMTESSPDAMTFPRSVRAPPMQNFGPGGVQDALMEANALGELEAEYELRLNNQRQGAPRGVQVQQFNVDEQQPINLNEFNSAEIQNKQPAVTTEDRQVNIVNHSSNVSDDFARFLFNESLSDLHIVVRKGPSAFDMNFNQILSKQHSQRESKKDSESSQTSAKNSKESADNSKQILVKIPCHKFVLSARCQYFFAQFCKSEWSDKNQNEACFTQFSEEPMREFLKYLYTGKLQIDTIKIMGILRISSFFGMEKLVETCKIQLTDPNILNAYDLSLLYCEVRECSQDFDDMKAFLTTLIPKRVENHMICSILKEIWIHPNAVNPQSDRDDQSRSTEQQTIQQLDTLPRVSSLDTDLQDILVQRIQTTLNEVLEDPMICDDLFKLPNEALKLIISSSETCINEWKLFTAIHTKIQSEEQANEDQLRIQYLRDLAKCYVRISQLDVKKLVTDIKFCKIFEDDLIFKAIQYNVVRDVIDQNTLHNDLRFVPRGLYTFFDFKHFDLDIQMLHDSKEMVPSHQNCFLKIKRDKICQSTDEACLSAIMSEPLPMHGIHYWEFKVKAHDPKKISQERNSYEEQLKQGGTEKSHGSENDENNNNISLNAQSFNQDPRQVQSHHIGPGTSINISDSNIRPAKPRQLFVGLCQVNENHSMEDTHQNQNSVMLNLLDSNFWCNGQQIQNFQSKNIKIKNPFEVERKNNKNGVRAQQDMLQRGRPRDSEEMVYTSSQGRNTRANQENSKYEEQESDIIRVAVDLRYASNFQNFWNENQDVSEEEDAPLPEPSNLFGQGNQSIPRQNAQRGNNIAPGGNGGRMQYGRNRQRNQIGVVNQGRGNPSTAQNRFVNQGTYRSLLGQRSLAGVNHHQGATRPSGMGSFNQSYVNLQRRIQESMRDVRNAQSRHNQNLHHHNLNLFLNLNNAGGNGAGGDHAYPSRLNNFSGLASELSMMLFSQSPSLCKIHYAVNDSEWSEGIDLNLTNLKKAPLNLVVSMPPEMDYQPELLVSRAAYFAQWEMVPKDSLFLKKVDDNQQPQPDQQPQHSVEIE